ncbi:putative E3 ubiquitin-protein ligase UBR7 [Orussus abietinus]|uniref:putative E3 ubiquitin-protein ligase UBR7 n=1 Tax=Orussus abietinus TaxID=222816 RepID=UPI0006268F5E|nr:putative E3 ubiquitin-protein ligase UBR7 [Orussus abietinus]
MEENQKDENSVTMLDVLREENQLEEGARAVLGASDDRHCTYEKGYIRQALYACKTCHRERRAAICLACSFHCHEGHELVELYTKRHFRCDCGNSSFTDKKCSLDPTKAPINEENKYDQNFDGVYCICSRPYPDPDSSDSDEMIQCVICEDWYHSKHLDIEEGPPDYDDYDEMVCTGCMKKHDFLWKYAASHSVRRAAKESPEGKEATVDVETPADDCVMPPMPHKGLQKESSCFWKEGWRSALCTCRQCKTMYEEKGIAFLLDSKDSVRVYEEAGKADTRESQYERGMKALASLDRVQQVNAIEEYNNMKERLKQYLQKFAENKKVVREEDIKEFFMEMEAKKRPKVSVPKFCR